MAFDLASRPDLQFLGDDLELERGHEAKGPRDLAKGRHRHV